MVNFEVQRWLYGRSYKQCQSSMKCSQICLKISEKCVKGTQSSIEVLKSQTTNSCRRTFNKSSRCQLEKPDANLTIGTSYLIMQRINGPLPVINQFSSILKKEEQPKTQESWPGGIDLEGKSERSHWSSYVVHNGTERNSMRLVQPLSLLQDTGYR